MERRKYSVLCCIGFILAVPLQLILITMSYLNRITLSAFTIWVSITLITILLGLVLSIIGVITAKKGVIKGKILGIIGIVFSVLGIVCVSLFFLALLWIGSGVQMSN